MRIRRFGVLARLGASKKRCVVEKAANIEIGVDADSVYNRLSSSKVSGINGANPVVSVWRPSLALGRHF